MTTVDLFELDEVNDTPTRHLYKQLSNQVASIDERLDAGTEAAGKRKVTNNLVENFTSEWTPVSTQIVEAFQKMLDSNENDRFVGTYFGILRALNSAFKDTADEYVKGLVEAQPKNDEEVPSDEEKKALAQDRAQLVAKLKTIVDMAIMFDEAVEEDPNWPLPKRRGAVGKRGKRALSEVTWEIDGVTQEGDDGVTVSVAKTLGFEKSSEFTAALKAAGVNTTNPDPTFTVTINGHQVTGTRDVTEEVEDEDDDSEEEE